MAALTHGVFVVLSRCDYGSNWLDRDAMPIDRAS